ncbi:uncharacterized protein LOC118309784 [Scophthalmus maximus]|uniref:uncharacterized protein LOC118309784 n=1 Tax=Scophthalmus maximus TaxID=52904 RepID=UPI001FA856E3|nr:uncharacterized protein LOC118309784 [Scophthalmus maximus]XP_047188519.1 uncharacterized protein LOC118309784 [Scophthalmus maximus]XP_047188520.1 uncharacterized protein LOC118309784 [Scophthalmus maximus]
MFSTADLCHIQVAECSPDSSATVSDEDMNQEHEGGSLLDLTATTEPSQLSSSEESGSESLETLKCKDMPETTKWKKPQDLQKTVLELPRMMPLKPLTAPTDSQSFLARLTEAYKDLPDDQKPVITKMGLTADVELVDCDFGEVPKGCPLSYQCPVPSPKDYKTLDDAPSRPLFPMSFYRLEPVSRLPNLSAQEQEHVTVRQITWDAAHILELSTRECKEPAEELCKLRLTSHFKEICKLKPGQDHAERLISKMHNGFPRCKSALIEKNMKTEALREYCRHLCLNWYPCGLVVHPNAPWLGALPDGLVYDPNENPTFGLVHVKCIEYRSFVDCSFLVCWDGILKLNTGHPYYWHIQGEMIVTGTSWCDLFVISTDDMLVQRIYRDKILIKYMMTKLHNFFFCYYLRSLLSTCVTA